jgi:Family of unknown function (DUF5677)
LLNQLTQKTLLEAKAARGLIKKTQGQIIGLTGEQPLGDYLANYSSCLFNRQIDIFDDSLLLLDNNRIPSACAIARGMIETYAFAIYLANSIADILDKESGDEYYEKCSALILKFTNSSRFKEKEQKKLKKGILKLDEYVFTDQAKIRMQNMLAESQHVLDALRYLFDENMKATSRKESQFEILYDILSEWVHPSQTSVFHTYVPATHVISSSIGSVQLLDVARSQCATALHFITGSLNIHNWLLELAAEVTQREPHR